MLSRPLSYTIGRFAVKKTPSSANKPLSRLFQVCYKSTVSENRRVVFFRHGQSTWNKQNIFIGMTDTPLTEEGVTEAIQGGQMLKNENIDIDVVYTSLLRRSTKTVWLALEEMGLEWVPVHKNYLLNERSYGALVGMNKKECADKYGTELVRQWRRSWDTPPPPMDKESEHWPGKDHRYQRLGITDEMIPFSESLKMVTKRTSVFWDTVIIPELHKKKTVMIVGHENNLRSIIKRLDDISDEDILHIELPRAIPLVYDLDPITLKPVRSLNAAPGLSGRYLTDKERVEQIYQANLELVYGVEAAAKMKKQSDKVCSKTLHEAADKQKEASGQSFVAESNNKFSI